MKFVTSLLSMMLMFAVFLCVDAFAQAVAQPTWGDSIINFIANPGTVLTIVSFCIELALRIFPSSKALSLLVPVRYAVNVVVIVLGFLMKLLDSAISAANNVQPKA